jgi:hypothetical protein
VTLTRCLAVQREAPALHRRAHCRMVTAWILGSPPPLRFGFRPRMTKGGPVSRDGGHDATFTIRGIGKGGPDVFFGEFGKVGDDRGMRHSGGQPAETGTGEA